MYKKLKYNTFYVKFLNYNLYLINFMYYKLIYLIFFFTFIFMEKQKTKTNQ